MHRLALAASMVAGLCAQTAPPQGSIHDRAGDASAGHH